MSENTLKAPHLDYIKNNKIDIDSAKISSQLKLELRKWDKNAQKYNSSATDSDLKNKLKEQLEKDSPEILKSLEAEFKDELEKADKEKADKEKADKEKADKEKADKEKADKEKSGSKANPYELSDKQLENKKIIDKLFSEKAVKGELTMTESELTDAGFDCWNLLGMMSAELGPYLFTSPMFSSDWTITKKKDKKED